MYAMYVYVYYKLPKTSVCLYVQTGRINVLNILYTLHTYVWYLWCLLYVMVSPLEILQYAKPPISPAGSSLSASLLVNNLHTHSIDRPDYTTTIH